MRRIVLLLLPLWLAAVCALEASPRTNRWNRVEEAMRQGLPKTALEELKPITSEAVADKAWAEATRAMAMEATLESASDGGNPEERIRRLAARIEKAPAETRPVLETLLAHWFWAYFRENEYRFMERTRTGVSPSDDFTAWDLPRIFAEIDRHFSLALTSEGQLKAIPIAEYDDLLSKGGLPGSYRPTLYDFIAQEALSFYTSGEQAGAKPEESFTVDADSPILGPVEEFMAWQPASTDTGSATLKAIQLYQRLLAFHKADADPSAFLDLDIARLVYAKNVASGEARNSRLKAALKAVSEKHGDHPLAALALYHWASLLREEDALAEAHETASRGKRSHPDGPGGKLCGNVVAEIEAKSASITTERVWNAPFPKIRVTYKNVTNVWFRAVSWDWEAWLRSGKHPWAPIEPKQVDQLLHGQPTLEWRHPLEAGADFKVRTVELPAPESLKPGFYFLIASHNQSFTEIDNQVSATSFWVSNLALVLRSGVGAVDGLVLEADSGEPVTGAQVESWVWRKQRLDQAQPPVTTGADGFFSVSGQQPLLLRASFKGDQLAAESRPHPLRGESEDGEESSKETVLFTDRAIYRPGQTVHYKGICIRASQRKGKYETLGRQQVKIAFMDDNDEEIGSHEHEANDYGSFAGSFTLPRSGQLGFMRIEVVEGPEGEALFRVEEYKRPRFRVTLAPPKAAARLKETVAISGVATTYSGAAVDGAQVSFRVMREVRMPWWWGWRGRKPGRGSGSQRIAHGVLKTARDGTFTVSFVAKPDLAVPWEDEPIFDFWVNVDVTDSSGETQSADFSLRLGYTAMEAKMTAADWQTEDQPVGLTITTSSLDEAPLPAEGIVKVYRLRAPEKVHKSSLSKDLPRGYRSRPRPALEDRMREPIPEDDMSAPERWPLGSLALDQGFSTSADGKANLRFSLKSGVYRAMIESQDRLGTKVTGRLTIRVINPAENRLPIKVPHLLITQKDSFQPGEEFLAVWGTGYDKGRAFIEIECDNKIIQRYWTQPGRTQTAIRQAVGEKMRGGFTLRVTQVRENRAYLESRTIQVPWKNKELSIKWEHFTSKLKPGQKETWTATITGPGSERVVAEVAAALYDASLDAFVDHELPHGFERFREERPYVVADFANWALRSAVIKHGWRVNTVGVDSRHRAFPPELMHGAYYGRGGMGGAAVMKGLADGAKPAPEMALSLATEAAPATAFARADSLEEDMPPVAEEIKIVDANKVSARKNLNETAFFFPRLMSDKNGAVRITFTMPEALTEWRFFGFAHDRACRSGFLEARTVTASDFMVQPNPPRFLREGDVLEFTVRIFNQSDVRQQGTARLTLEDAFAEKSLDTALGNLSPDKPFDVPPKESRTYSWRLTVPDGLRAVSYKAVAASDAMSDGEEGVLPVLSRRTLVIESMPLPIRGPSTNRFQFARLADSGKSSTLRHHALTVQMVSNPAWYAVLAMPYLMEFPHECSEQVFNRFYANTLARFMASSDARIRRVFERWKNTPSLDSPIEKNANLKSVLLEATPWVADAQAESKARKNIGILFDDNRLEYETGQTLEKLQQTQLSGGAWSWFPDGRPDTYMTLYIATGFGRLRHLGVNVEIAPAVHALEHLDAWIKGKFEEIAKRAETDKDKNTLSSSIALYLYGRSLFLKERPIDSSLKKAVDYFLDQARRYWLELPCRQSQAHVALALKRFGDAETPKAIVRSLKERATVNPEMGMFWRDAEESWWWDRAPIETQAMMIEAFSEVARDTQAVEDCQLWLLKQKQTQNWPSTKATADAIYALLLTGRNMLASDAVVGVTVGGVKVKPEKTDAGTGCYEKRFTGQEVASALASITVKKTDAGAAWGSVHWQYFEDISKITPSVQTPLSLKKAVFRKKNTDKGPVIEPVSGPLAPGEELVLRIELRADRDFEYVQLKDCRASGTEPTRVLSGYSYRDGLAYYESTRDAASHFFIDYLPKGTYVFEYSTRVVHRGTYQTGMAEFQCLYAPEFNSHSESLALEVR